MIVRTGQAVTLIGGAGVDSTVLTRALAVAPVVVAADGGADHALRYGLDPTAVIGDFDSVSDTARTRIPPGRLHPVREQDSTDFDKCLRNIAAPLIVGVGFSDGRFDHLLATCNALCRHPDRRCIILGQEDLILVAPPRIRLDLAPGTRVSLFPMGPVTGQSEGLEWPIDGLPLHPDARIATSNRATGPVTLTSHGPGLLIILPQDQLDPVLAALPAAPQWPRQRSVSASRDR